MGKALTHLELHPLSSLFPRLSGVEFDSLCNDIKANGLREPITLHDGMILDGGNRYAACAAAEVEPRFVEFSGDNIVSFVLSANLHRRHMTPGQQAAIVASAQDWARAHGRGGDRRSDQTATLPFESVAQRAAESGASERTQRMADKVAKNDPALAKRVARGEVSLPQAVAVVEGTIASKKKTSRSSAAALASTEHAQAAEDAFGDLDLVEELKRAHAELEALAEQIKALSAGDQKTETLKWRKAYEHAMREQSAATDRAKQAVDREAWAMRQLRRCGKVVGQDDPSKTAAAVEAFVRSHKVAA